MRGLAAIGPDSTRSPSTRLSEKDAPSFGLFGLGGIFGVLRTLSFWRMKDLARSFGETAGSTMLARMMQAAPRNMRFHLMGHSFGCIVMSATLAGPRGRGKVARPVESLALIQGAIDLVVLRRHSCHAGAARLLLQGAGRSPCPRAGACLTQSVFDTRHG